MINLQIFIRCPLPERSPRFFTFLLRYFCCALTPRYSYTSPGATSLFCSLIYASASAYLIVNDRFLSDALRVPRSHTYLFSPLLFLYVSVILFCIASHITFVRVISVPFLPALIVTSIETALSFPTFPSRRVLFTFLYKRGAMDTIFVNFPLLVALFASFL